MRWRGVAGVDRWGRSIDLPATDPVAVQTRSAEVTMHDQ